MLDGKPWSYYLYPPYPWREERRRKRMLAILSVDSQHGVATVTDETGERITLPNDGTFYDSLAAYALSGNRTIYAKSLQRGPEWDSFSYDAVHHRGHKVLYSKQRGVVGITFSHGRHRGAVLRDSTWYRQEASDSAWLALVRRTLDTLSIGDYDTAGSLGAASLSRFWTLNNIPRHWRLPYDLLHLMHRYRIGGRAEVPGMTGGLYPQAFELDLSSAYPTAVMRGLPLGRMVYSGTREPTGEAVFGVWRIHTHQLIPFSPLPMRAWDHVGTPISWQLEPEIDFTYAGWREEVEPLRLSGQATVTFERGWCWDTLSTVLTPWMEGLVTARETAEEAGDTALAGNLKLIANAAIGRWSYRESYEVVSDEAHDLRLGDTPLESDNFEMDGTWIRPVPEDNTPATPAHIHSYVLMAVRMELWRRAMAEMQNGGYVVMTNFDAVWLASQPTQSDNPDVQEESLRHPWRWKVKTRLDVSIPYNRAVQYITSDGKHTQILPGISPAMRMAMLVDHQRKRQASQVQTFASSAESEGP